MPIPRLSFVCALMVIAAAAAPARAQTPDGRALYEKTCAVCHDSPDSHAPPRDELRTRTPETIFSALVGGVMMSQARQLSDAERRTLAEYLSGQELKSGLVPTVSGRCETQRPFEIVRSRPAWNGWGASLENTRFQSTAHAGLSAAQVPKLRLKWAFGFPNTSAARAQPAVAGGRVFVGSENGVVYSLDVKTGCTYWAFTAKAGVRTAISIGPRQGRAGAADQTLYFGDFSANVYALDAATGTLLWSTKIDDSPYARVTGSPALYRDRLYVPISGLGEEVIGSTVGYECCKFRGSVVALEVASGKILWKTYSIEPEATLRGKTPNGENAWGPSGGSIWMAPTIDSRRNVLYIGTGNQFSPPAVATSDAILAIDLESGKIKWASQRTPDDVTIACRNPERRHPNCPTLPENRWEQDLDFGSSPMLVKANGRDLIVVGQKSGIAWALDPDKKGEVVWQYRAGTGSNLRGGIEFGAASDGDLAYFAVADVAPAPLGGLHAVRLVDGKRVWFAPPPALKCAPEQFCDAAQPAAVTAIPGVVFSGSVDGGLRGFSTKDGSLIWEFDANREFEAVNGVKAKGASFSGAGPTIVDGMLLATSGYGYYYGRAGNVLLAFGVAED